MKLIVGLGNPGKQYEKTRHNIGFRVLDCLIEKEHFTPWRLEARFNALLSQADGVGENRIIFAKPQTYMNQSGESVAKLSRYYRIGADDLIIICDDLSLPLGTIRVRLEGSSGGHNGLNSIIDAISSDRFARVKVGIGSNRQKNQQSEKYVLSKFSAAERKTLKEIIDHAAELLLKYLKGSIKEETIKIV